MPITRVNSIGVYYEVHGEGEPVLLIGGLGIDLTQLEPMINTLSRKYQVIAFDNRGVGRTDKPEEPYSIEIMAGDTAGLVKALHLPPVNVIGISMGGRIAITLALEHPEIVKSLILASTSARTNYKRGLTWSLSNLLLRIPAVRKIGTKYPQPYYAYVRQRETLQNYDTTDKLQQIHVPTLILHGRRDRIVPYRMAEEIHSRIAGSRLSTVDGGHTFFFRRSKEFTDLVTGFLGTQ